MRSKSLGGHGPLTPPGYAYVLKGSGQTARNTGVFTS